MKLFIKFILLYVCFLTQGYAQTATISGRVTDGTKGISVLVTATSVLGSSYNSRTALDGSYAITGVPAGTYYLTAADNAFGSGLYIKKAYPNVSCGNNTCPLDQSTPLLVSTGAVISGINFTLELGGKLTTTVTDGVNPLDKVSVYLADMSGSWIDVKTTNAKGQVTFYGKNQGTYKLYTSNSIGFINKILGYGNCIGSCIDELPLATTGLATVSVGAESLATLALERGAILSGVIKDRATNKPIASAGISAYIGGKLAVSLVSSDANGYFQTKTGLGTGSYVLVVKASGYHAFVTGCGDKCLTSNGVPVSVTAPLNNVNNFNLLAVSACDDPLDSDKDGTLNCYETCDKDPLKVQPGFCGCGVKDVDLNKNNILDCQVPAELRFRVTSLYTLVTQLKREPKKSAVGTIAQLKIASDELVTYLTGTNSAYSSIPLDNTGMKLSLLIRKVSRDIWRGNATLGQSKRKLQRLLVTLSTSIKG